MRRTELEDHLIERGYDIDLLPYNMDELFLLAVSQGYRPKRKRHVLTIPIIIIIIITIIMLCLK